METLKAYNPFDSLSNKKVVGGLAVGAVSVFVLMKLLEK